MATIKIFSDSVQFYKVIQNNFLEKEAEHNLLFGITKQIMNSPEFFKNDPFMAVVWEKSIVSLACLMTPPRDLILAANYSEILPSLDLLANTIWQQGVDVNGVNAEKKLAATFAHLWSHRGSFAPVLQMKQRIYRLDTVMFQPACTGAMRKAEQKDRELLIKWAAGFLQESLGEDEAQAEQLVEVHLRKENLFVWEDIEIVSMAAKSRETITGAVVSFVYTPPEKRKNGYATALVAGLSNHLLKNGYQFCALFTDLANPTSNAIYQKIGYFPVMDYDRYVFSKDLT